MGKAVWACWIADADAGDPGGPVWGVPLRTLCAARALAGDPGCMLVRSPSYPLLLSQVVLSPWIRWDCASACLSCPPLHSCVHMCAQKKCDERGYSVSACHKSTSGLSAGVGGHTRALLHTGLPQCMLRDSHCAW